MKSRQTTGRDPGPVRRDAVDAVLEQWARERPDLDASPMGPIGRIKRCAALLERALEAGFARFGLELWEFDMLATLRRAGAPHRLSPTELFSALMVTSGTMTHRLKRLEQRGLVQRVPNQQDARSVLVQLTRKGLALIDRAVEAHVENERRLLAALPAAAVAELDARLSALLVALEGPSGSQAADDRT
ncbi:transcriptional regulator, MarR family [Anaeromyxobacter dehalogenans 2CP-1]|uniref:Transcriptional regulator, MarR family n=1 Tax=Anaeromyxobacter dehalogenans (strain ATCC BAA-258 / DSM 21875 / 2CP-1) TaxID=455488 RepID=B8JAM7_ANAD2|nr:MarR family transcriptional regulator [Anaeromyxobacter dehalogenans]ACL67526.1 transcriptional regulator, MarR family [Anaeromyxobacter dehalogenans 2CP-1]